MHLFPEKLKFENYHSQGNLVVLPFVDFDRVLREKRHTKPTREKPSELARLDALSAPHSCPGLGAGICPQSLVPTGTKL